MQVIFPMGRPGRRGGAYISMPLWLVIFPWMVWGMFYLIFLVLYWTWIGCYATGVICCQMWKQYRQPKEEEED